MKASQVQLANFLAHMAVTHQLSQSAIAVYRSAISKIHPGLGHTPIGQAPLVSHVVKGVGIRHPEKKARQPRYDTIWDAGVVLDFIKQMPAPVNMIDLSAKTAMLLSLSSFLRASSIANLSRKVEWQADTLRVYYLPQFQEKANDRRFIEIQSFPDMTFDPAAAVIEYMHATAFRLTSTEAAQAPLFLATRRPYQKVTPPTISRWLLNFMQTAGIDIQVFRAHSTRAAGARRASSFLTLPEILKRGGWRITDGSSRTFVRFYDLPLQAIRCLL